jgi:hypothetical protein
MTGQALGFDFSNVEWVYGLVRLDTDARNDLKTEETEWKVTKVAGNGQWAMVHPVEWSYIPCTTSTPRSFAPLLPNLVVLL